MIICSYRTISDNDFLKQDHLAYGWSYKLDRHYPSCVLQMMIGLVMTPIATILTFIGAIIDALFAAHIAVSTWIDVYFYYL